MPETEPIPDIKDIIPPPEIADSDSGVIIIICASLVTLLILSTFILFWILEKNIGL